MTKRIYVQSREKFQKVARLQAQRILMTKRGKAGEHIETIEQRATILPRCCEARFRGLEMTLVVVSQEKTFFEQAKVVVVGVGQLRVDR